MRAKPPRRLAASLLLALTAALVVACGGGSSPGDNPDRTSQSPRDEVTVELVEYAVHPGKASAAAGPIRFIARNISASEVHELAVLRVKADGSFENTGEVEDIDPGKGGSVTLLLPAGKYVLACLIVPGEAGSTRDHYQEGMHIDFEVR